MLPVASEPLLGPVNPKQGMNSPFANLGKKYSFCSSVPYNPISSPGPSEFGTIVATPNAGSTLAIFVKMSDNSLTDNLIPPYFSLIKKLKNLFFAKYCTHLLLSLFGYMGLLSHFSNKSSNMPKGTR